MTRLHGLILVTVLMLGVTVTHTGHRRVPHSGRHVVLIGASIGQAWNLARWGERVGARDFSAESIAVWQFDKTEALEEALMRPGRAFHATFAYLKSLFRPAPVPAGIVILKECSSYFPANLDSDLAKVHQWIRQIRGRGIIPILATVVPVTRDRAMRDAGKQESLIAFNRRLRLLAQEERLTVLDLETALSDQTESAYLRDEYTSGDGSHLNAAAYEVLDRTLLLTLRWATQSHAFHSDLNE